MAGVSAHASSPVCAVACASLLHACTSPSAQCFDGSTTVVIATWSLKMSVTKPPSTKACTEMGFMAK